MKWLLYVSLGLWVSGEILNRVCSPKRAARRLTTSAKKLYGERHEYAVVTPADFPSHDHAYYNRVQGELEAAGFRHIADVEDLTVSAAYPSMRTFIRRNLNTDGTVMGGIYQVKYRSWYRVLSLTGLLSRRSYYLDLETEFADGTFLCTSNQGDSVLSSPPAGIIAQRQPQATTTPALLDIHRQKVAELIAQGLRPLTVSNLEEYHAAQDRMQEVKNRHRQANGLVDLAQVQAIAEKRGEGRKHGELLNELAALRREEQPPSASNQPPPVPR